MTTAPSAHSAAPDVHPLWIGSVKVDPPVLQAPMAGFTNYAYRQIIRQMGGVGLAATEMLSARGVLYQEARGETLPDRLWGVRDEPRPLAVQIWDNDPETLAAVGHRLVEEFAVSVVDINFGCPVSDVSQKAKSGSYLLRYPDRIGEIVARVVAACRPAPVTAKIRLGATRDSINAIDVAQAIASAGAAAVTVHGRTACQMFTGQADWEEIARLRPHVQIPLIGNGDLKTASAAVEAFGRYGVDGVMIGRAGLARPWLFAQVQAALIGKPIPPEPTLQEQREFLLEHYRLVTARFGAERGTMLMRRFACCYAQGQPRVRQFRAAVSGVSTPEEFTEAVRQCFPTESPPKADTAGALPAEPSVFVWRI